MARKKKKSSKINQRIKKYFDDDPFDVGIERVESKTLSELFGALGIYDIEPKRELMLKTLRMIWSEADNDIRRDILYFFENEAKIYKRDKFQEHHHFDREAKIESLLGELDVTPAEAVKLREAFATVRSKKITITKMESKLRHIRFEMKKGDLEKELEGFFDIDDSFEFNASLKYEIYDQQFHKILTLNTKPYSYAYIEETPFEEIVTKVGEDKLVITKNKQEQIDKFLASIKDPHPYLSREEIVNSLRSSPPKTSFSYPMITLKVLKQIVKKKSGADSVAVHDEEILVDLVEELKLPYSSRVFAYNLELHVELDALLENIWNGKKFSFDSQIETLKAESEKLFLEELELLVKECRSYAHLLNFENEELYEKIYDLMLDLLGKELDIIPKVYRKTIRRFAYSIKEEVLKKQRQELLARTIRDFKNLFPIARDMKRKLTLHIGPTNSGKTYTAMQRLKDADTGYYLAPLRLLALEGYENLNSLGVDCSLITGEEQLINDEATHISSTIEMLNFDVDVDMCVIDEVQMIDDRDRGWAWANAIIGAPAKEIVMTGSPNAKEAIIALAEYLGEELEIIEFERKNPLELLDKPISLEDIKPATAVIAFSRKDVLKLKQRLSKTFSVSVVYGNLSPEVRREEARRFREGETQVLVATDAIAMGMNLPIKTILFSKADKFDGIIQRDLFPSEIHQISGRAGRYGLEERGYIGALDKGTLRVVRKNFHKAARKIATPFKVMANLEHIKLVGTILEENSLEAILNFFIENMTFNGPFYAASLDDMLEASKIVDTYDLDIATKYHLACAPLTLKSPYIITAYERYIHSLEKKEPVEYQRPKLNGDFAQTSQELLLAEDMVKEISLYLWLSYRFSDYFIDADKAVKSRMFLNSYIEKTLQKTELSQTCKLCGVVLPHNSKYSICESCFRKNYTRRGSGRRSRG
ncbi:MAG: helicase-related protein [Sulfurimonas sp.]